MQKRDRSSLKLLLVASWLIFSVTLSSWWIVFGLRQLERIANLASDHAPELARHQQMLMWEGGVLLLLFVTGGLALAYFVYQENKRFRQVNEFFATFTHELKTSIASMRIQAESLQEDLLGGGSQIIEDHHRKLLDRLMRDSVRLELQLENSLFLANVDNQHLLHENVSLGKIISKLQQQWPMLELKLEEDCLMSGDRRAIESVLKNLIQNSVIHGHARVVTFKPLIENGIVRIVLRDDGDGFSGDYRHLGKLFVRHHSTSGSGVGLYLAKQLMKKMNGDLRFKPAPSGFASELFFRSDQIFKDGQA